MTLKEVEKTGNRILFFAIIIAVVITSLWSCSTRKVAKSETVEQEKKTEQSTLVIETKVNDNTKIIDTSTSDEIEIVPIDNSKPITVNGKTYFNVQIKHSKKKNNIITVKDIKASQIKQKDVKTDYKREKQVREKKVERKSSYYWFLLLIPLYFGYRKFKDKIWFI